MSLDSQVRIHIKENKLEHVSRNPIHVTEMDETLIFSLSEQKVMAAYLLFTYIEHEVEFK